MKIGDRIVLKIMELNESDSFWNIRGINYSSIGTVTLVIKDSGQPTYIEVEWDNGSESLCHSMYLTTYKSENIPLPNKMFKRRKSNG